MEDLFSLFAGRGGNRGMVRWAMWLVFSGIWYTAKSVLISTGHVSENINRVTASGGWGTTILPCLSCTVTEKMFKGM